MGKLLNQVIEFKDIMEAVAIKRQKGLVTSIASGPTKADQPCLGTLA